MAVNVDGWMIPENQVKTYMRDREACAQRLMRIMEEQGLSAHRMWRGSEDGEAVVGLNPQGEIVLAEHLDPGTVKKVTLLPDDEALLNFLRR